MPKNVKSDERLRSRIEEEASDPFLLSLSLTIAKNKGGCKKNENFKILHQ